MELNRTTRRNLQSTYYSNNNRSENFIRSTTSDILKEFHIGIFR